MLSSNDILIIAGETSGDRHGAAVVRELKEENPALSFFGVGGNELSKASVEIVEHADRMAVMGFFEVIMYYRFLRKVFKRVLFEVDRRKPARAILIDYPGFNLLLAKELKKRDIPVTYYISPQLWAWKERRISIIRHCVDQLICIFPFEKPWYNKRGVEAHFVGHPLMDDAEPTISREAFFNKHGLSGGSPVVGMMPGSRQQEVNRHLGVMLSAVERLKSDFGLEAVIGRARGVKLSPLLTKKFAVETEDPESALRYSTVGIVSSGTISLQAVVYDIPSVVIYKMNPFSWWIAKRVSKVDYASMTNLIAGKKIFPELLQNRCTGESIAKELVNWLGSDSRHFETKEQLREVRAQLGSPGASKRAARLILNRLN